MSDPLGSSFPEDHHLLSNLLDRDIDPNTVIPVQTRDISMNTVT